MNHYMAADGQDKLKARSTRQRPSWQLPVAGRRIIDYAIERAQKFGVMFTEILDWNFSERLVDDFADMTRTGVPVFYMKGEGPMPKGLRDLEGYSSPLTGAMADGLVVVWGLAISMHTADEVTLEPVSDGDCAANMLSHFSHV